MERIRNPVSLGRSLLEREHGLLAIPEDLPLGEGGARFGTGPRVRVVQRLRPRLPREPQLVS